MSHSHRPAHLYEHRSQPLLSREAFVWRLVWHALVAALLIAVVLAAGAVGYRWTEGMGWLDALLNASMILGGMGPVDTLQTSGGKLFASAYALTCGVVGMAVFGVLFAPVAHRLLHRFHLDDSDTSR